MPGVGSLIDGRPTVGGEPSVGLPAPGAGSLITGLPPNAGGLTPGLPLPARLLAGGGIPRGKLSTASGLVMGRTASCVVVIAAPASAAAGTV